MDYLYHRVPDKIKGGKLMPLNELKEKYPKVYKEYIKKYEGRKFILKAKVKILNCFWNDVLHLTAINPKKVDRVLKKLGSPLIRRKWFKINPKILDEEKIVVSWNKKFKKFDIKDIKKYNKIPKQTLNYYKKEINNGRKPLLFAYTPHILYRGELNFKDMGVITV